MPAIATLAINDGAAVPVSHNFAPVTTDGSAARFADRVSGIPALFGTISHEVIPPQGSRTVNRVQMGYMIPIEGTGDEAGTVVRYSSAQVTLNLHPESTLQERKDLLAFVANSLDNASVKTTVENVEPFY